MRAWISRAVAPLIAGLATGLVSIGVLREGDVAAFVDAGITIVDLILFGITYGVGHRLIDRFINPADVAREDAAPHSGRFGG